MQAELRCSERLDISQSRRVFRVGTPGAQVLILALPEDISSGGVKLLSSAPLPEGEAVTLESDPAFGDAAGCPPLVLRVGWCAPVEGGGHLVGGAARSGTAC